MLRDVRTHRPQRLTAAWLGVLASVALLTAGAWTLRSAKAAHADAASLLLEFVWLFVVASGVLLIPFLLLARRRPGPRPSGHRSPRGPATTRHTG